MFGISEGDSAEKMDVSELIGVKTDGDGKLVKVWFELRADDAGVDFPEVEKSDVTQFEL